MTDCDIIMCPKISIPCECLDTLNLRGMYGMRRDCTMFFFSCYAFSRIFLFLLRFFLCVCGAKCNPPLKKPYDTKFPVQVILDRL